MADMRRLLNRLTCWLLGHIYVTRASAPQLLRCLLNPKTESYCLRCLHERESLAENFFKKSPLQERLENQCPTSR